LNQLKLHKMCHSSMLLHFPTRNCLKSDNRIFVVENGFLIDVVHQKFIQNLSQSSKIPIPCNLEIHCSKSFSEWKSLLSFIFQSRNWIRNIFTITNSFNSDWMILSRKSKWLKESEPISPASQIPLVDGKSCSEFDEG
jgi:hypothetical protein